MRRNSIQNKSLCFWWVFLQVSQWSVMARGKCMLPRINFRSKPLYRWLLLLLAPCKSDIMIHYVKMISVLGPWLSKVLAFSALFLPFRTQACKSSAGFWRSTCVPGACKRNLLRNHSCNHSIGSGRIFSQFTNVYKCATVIRLPTASIRKRMHLLIPHPNNFETRK